MKLTIRQLLNGTMVLGEISRKELPVKVSYALAKNIAKIEKELDVYNKEREKLIEKYSVKDENNKTIIDENNQLKIQDAYLENWSEDIKTLQDIEADIDIHKFKLDELINHNLKMTPTELMVIDYMIEE
ncbi:MAG: hypothetical protein RR657_02710 [Peptostreptococcaceae bacterium]